MPRCTVMPNRRFWGQRDIFREIQCMARDGLIPVEPVTEQTETLQSFAYFPAGWRAYGFAVPPGETLQVVLDHPFECWMRTMMVNKWGRLDVGLLQNSVVYRNLAPYYKNCSNEARAIYLIVDDPGWMSNVNNPYTLTIRRSWQPGTYDLSGVTMSVGVF